MISMDFYLIKRTFSLHYRIWLVRPHFQAIFPIKTIKELTPNMEAYEMALTRNSSYFMPLISSLIWSEPKKHINITPLNIFVATFETSYLDLLPSIVNLASN